MPTQSIMSLWSGKVFFLLWIVLMSCAVLWYQRAKPLIDYHDFEFIKDNELEQAEAVPERTETPVEEQKNSDQKIILYWNAFFGIRNYSFGFGSQPLIDAKCPITQCHFTDDRSLFNKSSVVIFSMQDIELNDLPSHRFPAQRFVFYEMESPASSDPRPLLSHRTRFNFFNWTMTYRLDSDIVQRDWYGTYSPVKTLAPKRAPIKQKSKLIAWFVSHCETSSKREDYVKELSRWLPVDIYGRCGNLTCPDDLACREMIRNDYKFYLSFENAICTDYVTEKLATPLIYDAVPIVMGGADYKKFAPAHSYIDTRDFDSPQQLADYILLLNRTQGLYERYFDWKSNYQVQYEAKDGWCELCRLANDDSQPASSYSDILTWWAERDDSERCSLPGVNLRQELTHPTFHL